MLDDDAVMENQVGFWNKCYSHEAVADIDENNVVHVYCPKCGLQFLMSLQLWRQLTEEEDT